jgi:hypothetical protein
MRVAPATPAAIPSPAPASPTAASTPAPAAPTEPGGHGHDSAIDSASSSLFKLPGLTPSYFRTYDQVKARINELAAKYPDLVTVNDIGDTAQKVKGQADRDIIEFTITNKKVTGPKPIIQHIGGVHAREISNPEILLRWAEKTLEGYGKDPVATSLLDTREIDLIPMVNPDGHVQVEHGLKTWNVAQIMTRKNKASNIPMMGTDLNRNFDFKWGGPGSGFLPPLPTYRGKRAASEPEVQAVQKWTLQRKPDTFIDWHSFSRLVLYPWGDTKDPAPDVKGLTAVAQRFASYNGYQPEPGIDLYPTTGTSSDWAYGVAKVPGFTIETGSAFIEDDKAFAKNYAANAPVLDYSAQIAADPYKLAEGPVVSKLQWQADGTITGNVNDSVPWGSRTDKQGKQQFLGAGQAIASVEATLDPRSAPGSGVALGAKDGKFDTPAEDVVIGRAALAKLLKSVGATPGADARRALVYVRAKDVDGNWGPAQPQWLQRTPA